MFQLLKRSQFDTVRIEAKMTKKKKKKKRGKKCREYYNNDSAGFNWDFLTCVISFLRNKKRNTTIWQRCNVKFLHLMRSNRTLTAPLPLPSLRLRLKLKIASFGRGFSITSRPQLHRCLAVILAIEKRRFPADPNPCALICISNTQNTRDFQRYLTTQISE